MTWRGHFFFGVDSARDPDTAKRKQKWVSGFRTEREAEDALVDLLGKVKLGLTIDSDMTPVADYLDAWLDGRVGKLAPLSVTQYRSVIRNHVRGTILGYLPLGKVRRAHVRQHAADLEGKGLAQATRHTVRAVLSRGFADAHDDELIAIDPTIRKVGRRESTTPAPKRFTVWTADERRSLLDKRLVRAWKPSGGSQSRRERAGASCSESPGSASPPLRGHSRSPSK